MCVFFVIWISCFHYISLSINLNITYLYDLCINWHASITFWSITCILTVKCKCIFVCFICTNLWSLHIHQMLVFVEIHACYIVYWTMCLYQNVLFLRDFPTCYLYSMYVHDFHKMPMFSFTSFSLLFVYMYILHFLLLIWFITNNWFILFYVIYIILYLCYLICFSELKLFYYYF